MATGPRKYTILIFLLLLRLVIPEIALAAATYSNPVYKEDFVVNFGGSYSMDCHWVCNIQESHGTFTKYAGNPIIKKATGYTALDTVV